MTHFVQEYAALRWSVVAAFLVTAGMVAGRFLVPEPARWPVDDGAAEGPSGLAASARALAAPPLSRSDHRESDAAHLIMCLVMLVMLLFPAGADPHAVHGLLTAVTVVFAILLVSRIAQWRKEIRAPGEIVGDAAHRSAVLGYHLVAAAAMLYAMSGHTGTGHGGPAPTLALVLAALFGADALAVLVAAAIGRRHWLGHPLGLGDTPSSAVVPHLVMAVGTAYMLVGAVAG